MPAAADSAVATAEKPQAVVESVKTFVYKNMKTIESALPRVGLTAESVARTALSQVYRNPVLETCDKISLVRAIIEAASLGLSFALGRAYLVPFNNKHVDPVTGDESWRMEATFMPGYQGLVDLVRRSAAVKSVVTGAVYEGDGFDYETGLTEDKFYYKKIADDTDESKLTHSFCIIRFLDGGYQFVVLDRKKIDKIRATSKAGNGPTAPWVAWFEEQSIKSAVKRCTKLCPASIELSRAIELDDAAEIGRRQQLAIDVPIVGDIEQAQLTAGTPTLGEPQQSATSKVSAAAADVLKTARASTPTAVPPPPAATAEQPGRGRPKNCPSCRAKGREPANTLKSPVERELNACDECRREETEAIRDEQKTSVAAVTQEPEEERAEPVVELAQKLRYNLMVKNDGNLGEAEIELSALTLGKVQKFEKLADYLRANPTLMVTLTEAMGR